MKSFFVTVFILISFLALWLCSCKQDSSKNMFEEYIDKAIRFESKGDFKKAFVNIEEAMKIDASGSNLYAFRGRMKSLIGEEKSALSDFSIAIKINPRNTLACFYKALSYSYLKMEDSAVLYFDKAIQTKTTEQGIIFEHKYNQFTDFENRTDVEMKVLRYNRGISLYEQEKDDQALEDFQFSLLNGYKKAECYSYLGIIFLDQGNQEKGCEMLKNGAMLKDSIAINHYKKYCIADK